MKKILLASSALVGLAFAGSTAHAAEPVAVTVGGYAFIGVGFKDVDPGTQANADGFGIMRDGEIFFNVRGTSDNGLTFAGRVELEAFTTVDTIDENYFSVSGAFGEVKVGGDDHASYNLSTGVFFLPGAKIGHYDDFAESNPAGTGISNNRFSDTLGIFYQTPNLSGFLAAVSYHPAADIDNAADRITLTTSANQAIGDVFSLGLNYAQSFGGADIRLSAGYDLLGKTPAGFGDDDGFMFGARVGFSGFAVGAHYKEGLETVQGAEQEYVGNISYTTGPWFMMAGVSYGEDLRGVNGNEVLKYAAGVRYNLAPGVTATGGIEYTDAEIGGANVDGLAAMAYIGLSF